MKRREFIIKGTALSAGVLINTSALASIKVDAIKKNVKIAIIGSGSRGTELITTIRSIEGLEVAAVCDVLQFRLDNGLAKMNGEAEGFTDYRVLLKERKIDAILIATPFYTHDEIALAAIDAGKHVYCERTIAKGIQGVQQMTKKVVASKLVFQAGHQLRSSRLYQYILDLVDSGKIGALSSIECKDYVKGSWRRPVPTPSLERSVNWRMYREYSGGLVGEISSDQIDFVNQVLKENPRKIMGIGGIDYNTSDGRDVYDNISLLYEYPSGVKASFKCVSGDLPGAFEMKLIGRKATITVVEDTAWIKYYNSKEKDITGRGELINIAHLNPSKQALIDFKDAIKNKTLPKSNIYSGGHTAIAVQLSLDAMYTGATQYWKKSYDLQG